MPPDHTIPDNCPALDLIGDIGEIKGDVKNLCRKIDGLAVGQSDLTRRIIGNGGTPGLTVRLDRVEQREKARKWVIRSVILAIIVQVGVWARIAWFGS